MSGYLLVSALHKQAFASATKHQLIAFLQVAAFTNRTAVLPFARFGEPAFVGFPTSGYDTLDKYFDVPKLLERWPCLRAISYETYQQERRGKRIVDVALQLGLPRGGATPDSFGVASPNCGKRTRPLVSAGATHACLDLVAAISATALNRIAGAVMITNWSQKLVGLGDALSPLFGDAFAQRGGCHDPKVAPPRDFPPLAQRWLAIANAFLKNTTFVCAHLRAEKLASAASGREKRDQWRQADDGSWNSPYMERCLRGVAAIATHELRPAEPVLLITDTDADHGTPSNQGSAHFRDWRPRGERLARAYLPSAMAYCSRFAKGDPDCAMVEAAACRRARRVLRFGSGTFSEFIVGDPPNAPPSTQYLDCAHINADAARIPPKI
ncbi:hypothetical protein CTAYLR_002030 [Chrysophaeum taylorii]|uniref:Uncharacterized protein n=1 Tax=Chrysophaeum taylorii TaxID=2483200 RepID=A0AAD7XPY7_9STRA|nr:hypothetical protein CTAYLR_002030 [Chrysophaeum taylorii]